MKSRAALAVAALALAVSAPALSQSKAAAAEALFDEGRKAMDQGDYATACSKFKESNRLDPAAGTELNLARCEEERGKLATAWELYRRVQGAVPESDERYEVAKKRAEALAARLPKLTVSLKPDAPKGTRVRVGEVVLESASLGTAIPMDPGKHKVLVAAPGRQTRTFTVALAESEQRDLEVAPGAEGEGDSTESEGGSSQRTWGWVAGGIGAAGLVMGSVTGVMALGKKSDADSNCPDKLCNKAGMDAVDSGKSLTTLSTVGFLVGVVGVGAGAYLILTSDSKEGTKTAIQASPSYGGAQFGLVRTW